MKKLISLFLLFFFFSSPVTAKDKAAENDPRIGQTIVTERSLVVVSNFGEWDNSSLAREIGYLATDLEMSLNCTDCPNEKIKVERIIPKGSELKIIGAFKNIPPWYSFDSTTVPYLIMRDDSGKDIVAFESILDNFNPDSRTTIQLDRLASFKNSDESKSFYIQSAPFSSVSNVATPSSRCPDFKEKFDGVIKALMDYKVSDIKFDQNNCAISLKANQRAFAYLLIRLNDWRILISPYEELP